MANIVADLNTGKTETAYVVLRQSKSEGRWVADSDKSYMGPVFKTAAQATAVAKEEAKSLPSRRFIVAELTLPSSK